MLLNRLAQPAPASPSRTPTVPLLDPEALQGWQIGVGVLMVVLFAIAAGYLLAKRAR